MYVNIKNKYLGKIQNEASDFVKWSGLFYIILQSLILLKLLWLFKWGLFRYGSIPSRGIRIHIIYNEFVAIFTNLPGVMGGKC